MSLKRIGSWGAAWMAVMLAGTLAFAQGMHDMQLFGHGDEDLYGGGQRANEGFFIDFTGLVLNVNRAPTTTFGTSQGVAEATRFYGPFESDGVAEYDSLSTSAFESTWSGGQRIEMGNICEHQGWMIGYTRLHQGVQTVERSGVHVLLEDAPVTAAWVPGPANPVNIVTLPLPFTGMGRLWGNVRPGFDPTAVDPADSTTWATVAPLPLVFQTVRMSQASSFQYVDAAYIYRMHPNLLGGIWEWSLGARWFEFQEDFNVRGNGGTLGDNARFYLDNHAMNELVGPMLALRITHAYRGWTFSTLGSFTAAANMQTDRQTATLNTRDDTAGVGNPPNSFVLWNAQRLQGDPAPFHTTEFSPLVELRVEAKYQMTRAMSFKAGWNGIWADNIARPSNMVDYKVNETSFLGIKGDNNRQSLLINGLELGIEFNR